MLGIIFRFTCPYTACEMEAFKTVNVRKCFDKGQQSVCIVEYVNKNEERSNTRRMKGALCIRLCAVCRKQIRSNYDLKRHRCADQRVGGTHCPMCQFSGSKKEVREHFSTHGIVLEKEEIHFSTEEEFVTWKRKLESDSNTKFVQVRSPRETKGGKIIVIDYSCYRDGHYRSKGKGLRPLKEMGSNKIDGHCPASLEVKKTDNGINVSFIKTHVGHENEIKTLDLESKKKKKTSRWMDFEAEPVTLKYSEIGTFAESSSGKETAQIILKYPALTRIENSVEKDSVSTAAKVADIGTVTLNHCGQSGSECKDSSGEQLLDSSLGRISSAKCIRMAEDGSVIVSCGDQDELVYGPGRNEDKIRMEGDIDSIIMDKEMIELEKVKNISPSSIECVEDEVAGVLSPEPEIPVESLPDKTMIECEHNYPSQNCVPKITSCPSETRVIAATPVNLVTVGGAQKLIYISVPQGDIISEDGL